MTNPGSVIYNLLKDSAPVGALIGNKIYPGIIPADVTYPAAAYSELQQQYDESKDGPIPTGNHSFDVDIYAKNYTSAQSVANAIKAALDWYSGTVNSIEVERVRMLDQQDMPYVEEKELFHIIQTFAIRVA